MEDKERKSKDRSSKTFDCRKFSDYREFIKHMPNTKFRKLTEVLSTIDTEVLIDL